MKITRVLFIASLLFVCAFLIPNLTVAAGGKTTLTEVNGEVFVTKAGAKQEIKADEGMAIQLGDSIRTGVESSVKLNFGTERQATLGELGKVTISELSTVENEAEVHIFTTEDGQKVAVKHESGSLWSKIKSFFGSDEHHRVETSTSILGVRGTLFLTVVDYEDEQLSVLDGVVGIERVRGTDYSDPASEPRVTPSQQVSLTDEQATEPTTIDYEQTFERLQPELIVEIVTDTVEAAEERVEQSERELEELDDQERAKEALEQAANAELVSAIAERVVEEASRSTKNQEIEQLLEQREQSVQQLEERATETRQRSEENRQQAEDKAREQGVSDDDITESTQETTEHVERVNESSRNSEPSSSSGSSRNSSSSGNNDNTSAIINVVDVKLDQRSLSLEPSEEKQLSVTFSPEDATNKALEWESSNDDVVTVTEGGKLTAIAEGTAIISVTTSDGGYRDEVQVTVLMQDRLITTIPEVNGVTFEYEGDVTNSVGARFNITDLKVGDEPIAEDIAYYFFEVTESIPTLDNITEEHVITFSSDGRTWMSGVEGETADVYISLVLVDENINPIGHYLEKKELTQQKVTKSEEISEVRYGVDITRDEGESRITVDASEIFSIDEVDSYLILDRFYYSDYFPFEINTVLEGHHFLYQRTPLVFQNPNYEEFILVFFNDSLEAIYYYTGSIERIEQGSRSMIEEIIDDPIEEHVLQNTNIDDVIEEFVLFDSQIEVTRDNIMSIEWNEDPKEPKLTIYLDEPISLENNFIKSVKYVEDVIQFADSDSSLLSTFEAGDFDLMFLVDKIVRHSSGEEVPQSRYSAGEILAEIAWRNDLENFNEANINQYLEAIVIHQDEITNMSELQQIIDENNINIDDLLQSAINDANELLDNYHLEPYDPNTDIYNHLLDSIVQAQNLLNNTEATYDQKKAALNQLEDAKSNLENTVVNVGAPSFTYDFNGFEDLLVSENWVSKTIPLESYIEGEGITFSVTVSNADVIDASIDEQLLSLVKDYDVQVKASEIITVDLTAENDQGKLVDSFEIRFFPQVLNLEALKDDRGTLIKWKDSTMNGVDGYVIFRGPNEEMDDAEVISGTIQSGLEHYLDTDLQEDEEYYYFVRPLIGDKVELRGDVISLKETAGRNLASSLSILYAFATSDEGTFDLLRIQELIEEAEESIEVALEVGWEWSEIKELEEYSYLEISKDKLGGLQPLQTPSNLITEGTHITWDKVENATEYRLSIYKKVEEDDYSDAIYIEDRTVYQQPDETTASYDLGQRGLEEGKYQVRVTAIGDGVDYSFSQASSFSGIDILIDEGE
ncbi:Ig-like domain-containing protein [Desertibacillus haloalkaliphilus]|uniref:Ig-like domain-containing protein n=1 Tax=Desertibacillus haloalkaliphilus TaxID=1328930 RepID=UPI001C27D0CD|nr:Ig-like domain-containing protein [Desertibacillus haloalkaliphilus]MBU8905951.1 Ig-like domain-containing protein [Desertibacillus haloalkaliphilus]